MRVISFFLLLLGCISCTNPVLDFTQVTIEEVFTDSLQTIRDIQARGEDNIWFSSGEGRVGVLQESVPKLASVRYNETKLKFKSIAVQDSLVYLLHPTRPALVYKLKYHSEGAESIEAVYTQEEKEVFYNAIAFWDSEKGILVGERENSDCLAIVRTMDAGATWQEIPCSSLPSLEKGEQLFASSNSNISVYGSNIWIATGGTKARVFYSDDYGETWAVHTTPFVQGEEGAGIFSIAFADAKHGVAIGGKWKNKTFNAGNKAYTDDAGKTWKLFANKEYPGLQEQVVFVPNTSNKTIVAVGEGGVAFTSDAKEWKQLSDQSFEHISFVNDSVAYASKGGGLYRLLFR